MFPSGPYHQSKTEILVQGREEKTMGNQVDRNLFTIKSSHTTPGNFTLRRPSFLFIRQKCEPEL